MCGLKQLNVKRDFETVSHRSLEGSFARTSARPGATLSKKFLGDVTF